MRFDLHQMDDFIAVSATVQAEIAAGEITAARLLIVELSACRCEGDRFPGPAVGFLHHPRALVERGVGGIFQFPRVAAFIQVCHADVQRVGVVQSHVAIGNVEVKIRIGRGVGAACVAALRQRPVVPKRYAAAAWRLVILPQPKFVVAAIGKPGPFAFPQRHPDARRIHQAAPQVRVGKIKYGAAAGIRGDVAGQHHVIGVFVKAVINAPRGASQAGD